MSFTPRNMQDLTSAMVAYLAAHPDLGDGVLPSDLAVGSLERTHLEALAVVMEEYDQRVADAIQVSIPESCYQAFGFEKLGATQAVGSVICSSYTPVPYTIAIPTGTLFQGPNGTLFVSTEDASIPSGLTTSDQIPVKAKVAGVAGNVSENSITRIATPILYVDLVTNPNATTSGSDQEGDAARSLRFQAFIRTLSRGTKEALEFAAMSVTGVTDARAVEPFLLDPKPTGVPFAGVVWLFVDDGTSSSTLPTNIASAVGNYVNGYNLNGTSIPGYKSAGVVVDILKANPKLVRVRGSVKLAAGAIARWTDIKANMSQAVVDYFDGLRIAEAASYQNLVTAVRTSDPDLRDVTLAYWFDGDTVPDYGAAIQADNLSPYNPSLPLSVGSRLRAMQSTANDVTYPEWILSNG